MPGQRRNTGRQKPLAEKSHLQQETFMKVRDAMSPEVQRRQRARLIFHVGRTEKGSNSPSARNFAMPAIV
jgi:hypothetical protein